MEPPPFGDGNQVLIFQRFGNLVLQWSHRPSAMETRSRLPLSPCEITTFNGATALRRWKRFQPQPIFPLVQIPSMEPPLPSMEPPPFGDGNASNPNPYFPLYRYLQWSHRYLQWSHRPSAMETPVEANVIVSRADLQWSHRPSAMETRSPGPWTSAGSPPFNGATALRRWKLFDGIPAMVLECGLQWSHRPSAMETVIVGLGYQLDLIPSMEPPPFGDGNVHLHDRVVERALGPSMEPPPFGDGNRV